MEFRLLFYPNGSETSTAEVCVESDDHAKLEALYENTTGILDGLGNQAAEAREYADSNMPTTLVDLLSVRKYDNSAPGKVIWKYDNLAEVEELYFNEEDAIASVLYGYFLLDFSNNKDKDSKGDKDSKDNKGNDNKDSWIPEFEGSYIDLKGLTVTIDYKGDKYTDISKLSFVNCKFGISGVRFIGKKNGGEPDTFYLLTKTAVPTEDSRYEGHYILQSPSTGIVGQNSTYSYAGNCLHFKEGEFLFDDEYTDDSDGYVTEKDEDGNLITANPQTGLQSEREEAVTVAHLFFERNGEDFTFSVLINGKLHKKISKTDDAVIFYDTPFSFADPDTNDGGKHDIVFRKTNGVYLNKEHNFGNLTKAVNSCITMPPVSEWDGWEAEDYFAFYNECVRALYKAFENSEKYFITKYRWELDKSVYQWSDETYQKFATDDPPACQVTIERTDDRPDNRRHSFDYEDAKISVSACAPDGKKGFEEYILVPFPYFAVDSVAFTENDATITLRLNNDRLYVKITDKAGQIFDFKYNILSTKPDFDSTDIPSNLFWNNDWIKVKDDFELYRKVKDAVIKYGIAKCIDLICNDAMSDEFEEKRSAISKILYDEEGMIPDENVVSAMVRLSNEFERTGKIPNIALVGQAGTGKSTLAKKLGRVFKKSVLDISPSSLKGGYIGHTEYTVVQRLAEAAKNNQILFIDEAYEIMADSHGAEAIALLLPLMTGDRTRVEASLDRGQKPATEIDFGDVKSGKMGYVKVGNEITAKFEPGIVPIWLGGYENEIRMMISRNQGLYSRLRMVVIKNPSASDLLKQFIYRLEKLAQGNDKTSRKAAMLQKYFNENGYESVKKFFGWCAQPQSSKYFANHRGADVFLSCCLDAIDFGEDLGLQIEDKIFTTKRELKKQTSTVRIESSGADANDTINVITDIDTRFSDLVGCSSQIAYMQSIIEMLVNKSVYENYNLIVPKGALMEGPPGVGKTFIARAMAGELQERFQNEAVDKRFGFMAFSASELGNKPTSYIASIFSAAEEYDACVMFIDEVDAIAKHRSVNTFYDRYLELIRQMDGIEKRSNVFILAATNAPESLDPAFVRSGRIDKKLVFTLPDRNARREFARRAIEKRLKTLVNFNPAGKKDDIDIITAQIAKRTSGFTPGNIDNVINLAFVMYHQFVRYGSNTNDSGNFIDRDFFRSYPFIENDEGRSRIKIPKKDKIGIKDRALQEIYKFIDEEIERMHAGEPNYKKREEKFNTDRNGNVSSTAIHEVGHALVSLMLDEKPFDVITTLPRGNFLGYVSHSEMNLVTKSDYEKRIRAFMGGRIAEEIIYGKDNISTGALSDMQQATSCARAMIEMWGFSDKFGFMSLSEPAGKYLGGSGYYTCSEEFRQSSDIAVNELLQKLYRETFGMLSDKKELIKSLAKRVFDNETMTGESFIKLYETELKRNPKK